MKLNLKNPIIFFDLETTGTNVATDRIVEISYLKVFPNGIENTTTMRINPEMHIPENVSAVHGIYDKDVENSPTFKQVASKIAEDFKGADIAGYNSNRFDIPLLSEEFARAGVDVDLLRHNVIDVQTIFHKKEQRTLSAAYLFYCGKDLEGAHSADADTYATYEVLKAQLDKYPDLKNDMEFLAKYTTVNKFVDAAGRLIYNEKGEKIINFGKHKGKLVKEVLKTDPGYYGWIMGGDFTESTKREFTKVKLEMGKL